jgi:hypothetical protein
VAPGDNGKLRMKKKFTQKQLIRAPASQSRFHCWCSMCDRSWND